jgi:hypothetical protein
MKVADLEVGGLYAIDTDIRVVVVESYDGWIEIHKIPHSGRKVSSRGETLKGRPALYCGVLNVKANFFKQGWFRSHEFIINGKHYRIHGDYIRNVHPFGEVIKGDW